MKTSKKCRKPLFRQPEGGAPGAPRPLVWPSPWAWPNAAAPPAGPGGLRPARALGVSAGQRRADGIPPCPAAAGRGWAGGALWPGKQKSGARGLWPRVPLFQDASAVRKGRCAPQRKRLSATPLRTGLPPHFFRHWRRSASTPGPSLAGVSLQPGRKEGGPKGYFITINS